LRVGRFFLAFPFRFQRDQVRIPFFFPFSSYLF
jgi:hypothetical protein